MPPKLSLKRKAEPRTVTSDSANKISDSSIKTIPKLKLSLTPYRYKGMKTKPVQADRVCGYQWKPFPPSVILPEIYSAAGSAKKC